MDNARFSLVELMNGNRDLIVDIDGGSSGSVRHIAPAAALRGRLADAGADADQIDALITDGVVRWQ